MGCTNAKSVQVHNGSAIHNKKNESKENEDINGLINSKNETEKGSVINYNRINEKSFDYDENNEEYDYENNESNESDDEYDQKEEQTNEVPQESNVVIEEIIENNDKIETIVEVIEEESENSAQDINDKSEPPKEPLIEPPNETSVEKTEQNHLVIKDETNQIVDYQIEDLEEVTVYHNKVVDNIVSNEIDEIPILSENNESPKVVENTAEQNNIYINSN